MIFSAENWEEDPSRGSNSTVKLKPGIFSDVWVQFGNMGRSDALDGLVIRGRAATHHVRS